jgi:hypothetical protein
VQEQKQVPSLRCGMTARKAKATAQAERDSYTNNGQKEESD